MSASVKNWGPLAKRLGLKKDGVESGIGSEPGDIVILVLGSTGVGKSKFIQELTGDATIVVGHTLRSCTRDVSPYEVKDLQHSSLAGRRLILVDTPGFDSEYTDDAEIVRIIMVGLEQTFGKQKSPAGIVYLSDIRQTRIVPWRTSEALATLCGEKSFNKAVVATSQWDRLREELDGSQEQRAMAMYEPIVRRGAEIMHIRQKPNDQKAIITYLLDNLAQNASQARHKRTQQYRSFLSRWLSRYLGLKQSVC
ncbi:hypothetical protein BKA70DRAFT_1343009 [Coprinopsis sp. MPI-PUGE-AT-0042]|nr:hypothetical protein BKA70DRAFT_1343009 [Coprinopsis sp. MPI-PUGE-AT-0042]